MVRGLAGNQKPRHKNIMLENLGFIPEPPIWGHNGSISSLSSTPPPPPQVAHYTTEPPPLPVTQSALTPREFPHRHIFHVKETASILNLFDITRRSAFLCGVTGSRRCVRVDFKDIWWGVFWSKKMKVLHQTGSQRAGGLLRWEHHKSLWNSHTWGFRSANLCFVLTNIISCFVSFPQFPCLKARIHCFARQKQTNLLPCLWSFLTLPISDRHKTCQTQSWFV